MQKLQRTPRHQLLKKSRKFLGEDGKSKLCFIIEETISYIKPFKIAFLACRLKSKKLLNTKVQKPPQNATEKLFNIFWLSVNIETLFAD